MSSRAGINPTPGLAVHSGITVSLKENKRDNFRAPILNFVLFHS
jgi:hypothetical protein